MSKIDEFDGNVYVDVTLNENQVDVTDMNNMLTFIKTHKNVYLFGNGLCGTGMRKYFEVCGYRNIIGNITSDTISRVVEEYEKGRDGIIFTLKSDYYQEIFPAIWGKIAIGDVLFLKERTKQIFIHTFSKEYLDNHMWLTLPLALHCNINCASCNMFSPLCEPKVYTLRDVKKDMEKMKHINVKFNRINISGGEPFLNPEIVEILEYIRSEFPNLKIDVYTNGLLLHKLPDNKLEALSKCRAEFHITEYGIQKEKLDAVYCKLDKMNIQYIIDYTDEQKLFYKKVIDFDKKVPAYEYINCQYYTYCFALFLFNGRLFKCPMALNVDEINKFSEKKIELTEYDYMNLEDVETPSQIHDFWRSRLPLCGYCPRVTEAITWRRSERKIEEWMK